MIHKFSQDFFYLSVSLSLTKKLNNNNPLKILLTVNWIRKSNLRENTSKQASYRQASQNLLDEKRVAFLRIFAIFKVCFYLKISTKVRTMTLHKRTISYPSSDGFSKNHSGTDRLRTWNSTTWWWVWGMGRTNFLSLWRTNENIRGGRKNISRGNS